MHYTRKENIQHLIIDVNEEDKITRVDVFSEHSQYSRDFDTYVEALDFVAKFDLVNVGSFVTQHSTKQ